VSFHEHPPLALVKPGTQDEREQARLGAARMVRRAGGDAEDLREVLDALALWPTNDPGDQGSDKAVHD
jgi:hypothetical protein